MLGFLRRDTDVRKLVSEMINRVAAIVRIPSAIRSVDNTTPDYAWWDRLVRGKQAGYELGGLFAQPIAETLADWDLGKGFTATTDNDEVDELLADFLEDTLQDIIDADESSMKLGDAYLVVNVDGTLTPVSPDLVEIKTADLDYRRVIGYKITTKLEKATITDEYGLDKRTITIESPSQMLDGIAIPGGKRVLEFDNLIGRLPVIHFADGKGVNETHGHPIFEALRKLFAWYHDVLDAALEGVQKMGRPTPTVNGLEDVAATINANKTGEETVLNADGTTSRIPVIDLGKVSMFFTGKGGKFEYASPGQFFADTSSALKKLFYIMLEHIRIPEWVWGGAVASSKASVDAQTPAWIRKIEGRQRRLKRPLQELLEVWLATAALVMPVPAGLRVKISYPDLYNRDENLSMNWLKLAMEGGLLTDVTALTYINRYLNVVEDVEAEIEAAKKEGEEKQAAFDARVDEELNRRDAEEEEEAVV